MYFSWLVILHYSSFDKKIDVLILVLYNIEIKSIYINFPVENCCSFLQCCASFCKPPSPKHLCNCLLFKIFLFFDDVIANSLYIELSNLMVNKTLLQ